MWFDNSSMQQYPASLHMKGLKGPGVWSLFLVLSCLGGLLPVIVISGFPSSTKTNISEFQFDQDRGPT